MFNNYLKVTIRNIFKNKIYSFINIAGLAIGLAGFILITILIKNELSFDSFHKNGDRIYRVVEIQNQDNIGKLKVAVTMGPLATAMKDYFSGVENSARMVPAPPMFCKIGDKGFYEKDISFADPSIFDIFTIPFIEGNPKTALLSPFSIVLTKSAAHKYFGNDDPLGKALTISSIFGKNDYKITGVIKDYPKNSNMYFTMLASYNTMEHYVSWLNTWDNNTLATFVLLKEEFLLNKLIISLQNLFIITFHLILKQVSNPICKCIYNNLRTFIFIPAILFIKLTVKTREA